MEKYRNIVAHINKVRIYILLALARLPVRISLFRDSPLGSDVAILVQRKDIPANTMKSTPADTIMSPRPASGGTMPPKAYPTVPSKAEAVPALPCSLSIARALEAVNDIPTIDSSRKSRAS